MKIILLGNAGAGKSTLAKRLTSEQDAARLSLDEVAFASGAARRPLAESVAAAEAFIASNPSWIIEGCYADIIEPLLPHCDKLVFLNPGVEVCVAHCQARPWEPEKFRSKQEQDSHLDNLLAWVRDYENRNDEYGQRRHREIYDAFQGEKCELADPAEYTVA
ncbi:MAG: shikimate kinase [Nevskiales bacterium]